MDESKKILAGQDKILKKIESLERRINDLHISLTQIQGVMTSVFLLVDAFGHETLKSLARVEKVDENTLLHQKDKRVLQRMKEIDKERTEGEGNK